MKKNYLFLLFCLILCISCNKNRIQEKPDNLISQDLMIDLLVESLLIESSVYLTPDDPESVIKLRLTKAQYKQLFAKYHITKKQYMTSLAYYMGDETSAAKMLKSVEVRLAEKRATTFPDEAPASPLP
ncbi:MAG: DUF4296 domain-containing protein [Bacteroidales bacterium]